MQFEQVSDRACYQVVQRTVKSLRLATEVLRREGLVSETFLAGAQSCESLREVWSEWTSKMLLKVGGRKRMRLASALKGTKTLFDEPCRPCDKKNASQAKKDWAARALDSPQVTRPEVLKDIQSRARWYMGTRWWKEERVKERAYVPDQQGCAEVERGCGGTLSCLRSWDEKKDDKTWRTHDCPREGDTTRCRLGTAKKKGKVRVVTMQAARAKRILRPVHEAAYDHLCRTQTWIVRGDVTADHFKEVHNDCRPGEKINSGDFEASTDRLNKDAVCAVVEVLGEALPERRRKVLLSTFEDTWIEWEGDKRKIVRGSMMGNLLSFVVLCLLNKICLDRARQRVEGCGPIWRKSKVNGDDLIFAGSDEVFDAWVQETKEVGFKLNLKKTMRSCRYGDLNSTTFDFVTGRFLPRLNFGFLGTNLWKEPDGTVADCLFTLVKQLKFSTAAWLLNVRAVQSIFSRRAPTLSQIPRRWWQFLVKKRWFRMCMSMGENEALCESEGSERKLPFTLGPPLVESSPSLEKEIARLERKVTRYHVAEWRGVLAFPPRKFVPNRTYPTRSREKNVRLERGEPVWSRLWMSPVLSFLQRNCPWLFLGELRATWVDDQPGLQVSIPIVRKPIRPLLFAPPFCLLPLRAQIEKSGLKLPFASA